MLHLFVYIYIYTWTHTYTHRQKSTSETSTPSAAQWGRQNTLHKEAQLFVGDLFKHKGNSKWETYHISCSSITWSCVCDLVSLCVLQVFICACLRVRSSAETLSELSWCLVELLSRRDVPLRRWCVSLLFPWLAVKGRCSGGKLEQPSCLLVFKWA